MGLNGIVPDDPQLYQSLSGILKKHDIATVVYDDHLMFTGFKAVLAVKDEKIIIWEYYLPIDFDIPTIRDRIKAIRLADPNCFDQLRRFCDEQSSGQET